MAKFSKKKKKNIGAISTASLPDIVFMLLFFFMVSTVMRETDLLVEQKVPEATEVRKLERKSLVGYIYVGAPKRELIARFGKEAVIQLNDAIATTSQIANFVSNERAVRSETEAKMLTMSIKADIKSKMGIITDIKQELRKVNALKINYSARKVERI